METYKPITVIYNSDVKIIDFLADLHDREPIHALERLAKWGNLDNSCLLHICDADNMVVLILYKAPFDVNKGDNKLILYAHRDLAELYRHFRMWFASMKDTNTDKYKAVRSITFQLCDRWGELHNTLKPVT